MSDPDKTLQEQCYGTCWAATERIAQLERELADERSRLDLAIIRVDASNSALAKAIVERDHWREVAEALYEWYYIGNGSREKVLDAIRKLEEAKK